MLPRKFLSLLIGLGCLIPASAAHACNIPVFRYALERWRAEREEDRYQVIVFHNGPLSAQEQTTVAALRKLSDSDRPAANFMTGLVDVSGKMDAKRKERWQTQKAASLPWMVVRYPDREDAHLSAWSAQLTEENVRLLTGSPVRREIAKRILSGDSAVWILLECGDKALDDAAAELLRTELPKLEKKVALPEGAGEGPVKLLSDLPLRVSFPLLRLRRTDPAEKALVAMLLHSEDDLADSGKPIVFPVFGRGRALDALIGKGITADNLRSMAEFLCGACSCRVKRLNPGFDLLLAVDWDAALDDPAAAKEPERPTTEGQSVAIPPGTLAAITRAGDSDQSSSHEVAVEVRSSALSPVAIWGGIAVAVLLVLVLLLVVFGFRSRGS